MTRHIRKLLIVAALALVLTGCTDTLTGGKTIDMGKLQVYIEQFGKEAVVEEYSWDGTKEGLTVDIPDTTDDGVPITKIGARINIGVPAEFKVKLLLAKDSDPVLDGKYVKYVGNDQSLYDGPISFDKLVFTINPGANVKSTMITDYDTLPEKDRYFGVKKDDGSIVFYEPVIVVAQ